MHASPRPLDPYNPTSSEHTSSEIRHPSPFIPIRVPVFGLVIWLNDAIVRVLSVGSGPVNSSGSMSPTSPGRKMGYGRGRALSDAVESVEEGGGGESVPLASMAPIRSMGQAGSEMQQQQAPGRQTKTRERVMLPRRKAD
jgi:etoposide-induced 2.4 mRNA